MERNQQQFTRLWIQAQPVLWSFIGSMIPDFHEAEDVLQGVAVRLQQNFDQYDPSRSFIGWALGFARNDILMSRRAHSRSFIAYDTEIVDSLATFYEERRPDLERRSILLQEWLKDGRNTLARRVLELRYVDGLSGEAIASKVRMKVGAVWVMLHRVRKALKDCVERKARLYGESL